MNETSESIDYVGLLLRRRWVIAGVTLLIFLSSLALLSTQIPIYLTSALVLIERERDSAANTPSAGAIERSRDDYYLTQYKLLRSYTLLENLYKKLALASDPEFGEPNGVLKLQSAVAVRPVVGTRLVNVGISSQSPKRAMDISNALATLFVEQNLENQLYLSQEVLKALQAGTGGGGRQAYEMLPALVNNKLIQDLKSQEAELLRQIAEASQRYTDKHPAVQTLRTSYQLLKARLEVETDKAVSGLKTELSGQLRANNARVVDPARLPLGPVRPNRRLFILGGLIGGLGLGLVVAFLLDFMDQTIRQQDQVERDLKQSFLAFIPHSSTPKGISSYADLLAPTQSLSSEAFRNLRTMVDFAHVSAVSAPVLVTSTVQEEGKSHVATNLAVAYSQLHPRVLLIDGDLRRPSLHKKFNISSGRGLSNFLASSDDLRGLDGMIQDGDVPNLKILPCGPRPPNPSELLNTPKIPALLAWACERFDRVIVDCPPIFPVSDTILWGRHIRHAIFVVRYGKTRTPAIREAARRLDVSGIKNLGVVINAATAGGLSYAYYGHYQYQYYKAYKEEEAVR
ncbi:MAG: polysaccharide biosynthesis tyrosine autokinase [Elusimicrobia bacterium]|nr:polysaccharide biosynthesis tyrosine autokinase [Elusimicrobiota bacterium]